MGSENGDVVGLNVGQSVGLEGEYVGQPVRLEGEYVGSFDSEPSPEDEGPFSCPSPWRGAYVGQLIGLEPSRPSPVSAATFVATAEVVATLPLRLPAQADSAATMAKTAATAAAADMFRSRFDGGGGTSTAAAVASSTSPRLRSSADIAFGF